MTDPQVGTVNPSLKNETAQGIGVAPGICIGHAVVLGAEQDEPVAEAPVILVAPEFGPEDVISMDGELVGGFISGSGGVTDPAGIVACGAGLVAVLGYAGYADICSGDLLIIDGGRGEVVRNPSPQVLERYQTLDAQDRAERVEMARYQHLPPETRDGLKLDVLASVDLVDGIAQAIVGGAGGIGLLRSEFYYLTGDGAPAEDFLCGLYQHALTSVAPLPVTIRTLALDNGQQVQGYGRTTCPSPALGLHGARFSLAYPNLFITQLRALYRASGFGRLRILLPMVSSHDELQEILAIMAQVRRDVLAEGGGLGDNLEVGLLIEVPAAALMAQVLAPEVDFLMIGANNLIQYSLAVDRRAKAVAHLYDPLHPAVVQLISTVIQAGHGAGIPVGLCGAMAGHELYAPLFVGFGLDWLSVQVSEVGRVKRMIRQSVAADCVGLAQQVRGQSSSQKSKRLVREYGKSCADSTQGAVSS